LLPCFILFMFDTLVLHIFHFHCHFHFIFHYFRHFDCHFAATYFAFHAILIFVITFHFVYYFHFKILIFTIVVFLPFFLLTYISAWEWASCFLQVSFATWCLLPIFHDYCRCLRHLYAYIVIIIRHTICFSLLIFRGHSKLIWVIATLYWYFIVYAICAYWLYALHAADYACAIICHGCASLRLFAAPAAASLRMPAICFLCAARRSTADIFRAEWYFGYFLPQPHISRAAYSVRRFVVAIVSPQLRVQPLMSPIQPRRHACAIPCHDLLELPMMMRRAADTFAPASPPHLFSSSFIAAIYFFFILTIFFSLFRLPYFTPLILLHIYLRASFRYCFDIYYRWFYYFILFHLFHYSHFILFFFDYFIFCPFLMHYYYYFLIFIDYISFLSFHCRFFLIVTITLYHASSAIPHIATWHVISLPLLLRGFSCWCHSTSHTFSYCFFISASFLHSHISFILLEGFVTVFHVSLLEFLPGRVSESCYFLHIIASFSHHILLSSRQFHYCFSYFHFWYYIFIIFFITYFDYLLLSFFSYCFALPRFSSSLLLLRHFIAASRHRRHTLAPPSRFFRQRHMLSLLLRATSSLRFLSSRLSPSLRFSSRRGYCRCRCRDSEDFSRCRDIFAIFAACFHICRFWCLLSRYFFMLRPFRHFMPPFSLHFRFCERAMPLFCWLFSLTPYEYFLIFSRRYFHAS